MPEQEIQYGKQPENTDADVQYGKTPEADPPQPIGVVPVYAGGDAVPDQDAVGLGHSGEDAPEPESTDETTSTESEDDTEAHSDADAASDDGSA